MDTLLGSLANPGQVVPLRDPSVLIIESHPTFLESLPQSLTSVMPEVMFDVSVSRDEGLSKLERGHYHAVISDARLAEAGDYFLLNRAQALSCPVPFLVSEKRGDRQAVTGALAHGAFDMIRDFLRGTEAMEVIRRALWFYGLRRTIYDRKQRLEILRRRHAPSAFLSGGHAKYLAQRTIDNIEEADLLCQRTIQQIESSIRVLEDTCNHVEAEVRECAMRLARFL